MIHPELDRVRHRPKVRQAIEAYRAAYAEWAAILRQTGGKAAWPAYGSPLHEAERRLNAAVEDEIAPR